MITDAEILARFKGKQFLVVDDEKFLRSIVTRLILPFDAIEAGDGSYGLFQLAANPDIGLVLCDFNMPRMDGLTFLKEIRRGAAKVPNDMPVLMLTGHSDVALVQAALSLDVDGFIVKPVSIATLATRLKHLTGKPSPVKKPSYYEGIDLSRVRATLLPSAAGEGVCPGRRVKLADAQPKDVLAADFVARTGEVLVGKDVPLTERLIARLIELEAIGIARAEICLV